MTTPGSDFGPLVASVYWSSIVSQLYCETISCVSSDQPVSVVEMDGKVENLEELIYV